jgi:rSAM/selenodomain-associated transferase 1
MQQPDLILFAKKPIPGEVKTRLSSAYTPAQAAEIAGFLIRATVELAVSAWPGEVYLYVAPDPDHALFASLARQYHVHLAAQALAADLGARMYAALCEGIARRGAAAVMGCDVPHCGWEILDEANERLARGQPLLGPAEDGGYYFIGMAGHCPPSLFEGIAWGGPTVLEDTLARARALGLEFEFLPTLRDIDTPDDLWLVSRRHTRLQAFVEGLSQPGSGVSGPVRREDR